MLKIAKILLRNPSNEILVAYRSSTHPRYAHQPDLPGGEVEAGETPEIAVSRELLEETGIELDAHKIQLVAEKLATPTKTYFLLEAKLDTAPEVKLSWEHESYEWLSERQILDKELSADIDDYYQFANDHLSDNRTSQ